jgi:hypothetical protein
MGKWKRTTDNQINIVGICVTFSLRALVDELRRIVFPLREHRFSRGK